MRRSRPFAGPVLTLVALGLTGGCSFLDSDPDVIVPRRAVAEAEAPRSAPRAPAPRTTEPAAAPVPARASAAEGQSASPAPARATAEEPRPTGGRLLPGLYATERRQVYANQYAGIYRWRTLRINADGTARLTWHQEGSPTRGCAEFQDVFEMRYSRTADGSYDMSYVTRADYECGKLGRRRAISWEDAPLTVTEQGVMIAHPTDGVFHYIKQ